MKSAWPSRPRARCSPLWVAPKPVVFHPLHRAPLREADAVGEVPPQHGQHEPREHDESGPVGDRAELGHLDGASRGAIEPRPEELEVRSGVMQRKRLRALARIPGGLILELGVSGRCGRSQSAAHQPGSDALFHLGVSSLAAPRGRCENLVRFLFV